MRRFEEPQAESDCVRGEELKRDGYHREDEEVDRSRDEQQWLRRV